MPRSSRVALVASALALLAAPSAGAAQQCSTGDAATAASVIFGDGTEVVRTEEVAGLKTALVLQPYIAPGTRQRLVHAAGQWCSAEQGLNTAWLASGRSVGDGRALAAAYARLAAAPYFDGTTITSHTTAAGVHAITTHARTNGITAAWVVKTDAQGVRSATWTATGFAVKPFAAEVEGLTALKGATETYERAAGRLVAKRGLPTRKDLAIEAPAATLTYKTPDGWDLHVVASDSRQMPDVGQDTGNYEADKLTLRAVRRMVADNYQEFYDWGFRANWTAPKTRVVLLNGGSLVPASEKTGYIYMNDSVSPYCLACVFIADDFQIHMFQEVEEALGALGYSYPGADPYDVYSDIIGHEMFHNWQNNYYRPGGGRSVPGSYSEGTARFQETLHDYSEISHQPESLVYANDANGCNGALGASPDAALASGSIFQTVSYSACQFFVPWYTSAGPEQFVKLVTDGMRDAAVIPQGQTRSNARKVTMGLEIATGRPYVESAAAFARGFITGEGMTYGSLLAGGSDPRDWGKHLERWTPATMAIGESVQATLGTAGIVGREVTGAFRPQLDGEAGIAVIRDTAEGSSIAFPAEGELVPAPGAGERLYLIAARGAEGPAEITLTAARP
jgi:hypothetical protein